MTSRIALLLAAVFALLLLGTLGARPLYKADESRYAEIPREMAASGDWVTPRLNDFKYFEKPPLQYWTTAAFFKLFGEHDWAARLWTALTAIAGVVLVFFTGRRLFSPEAGALGAAVLAGCPLYVMLGQINTLDMGLSFFLSAAVFAFALQRYYLFWAACALAVLSKGLIGIVLPLGTVGLYVLIRRDWSLIKKIYPLTGSALFLAIAAPWFVAVSIANDEFAHFFFVQEHFQRFTTRRHGRYQPVWFFLPILAFGLAPWILPFLFSLRRLFHEKGDREFDSPLFLVIWISVVFAFFSISGSKLPSYILPMFPALALLIGRWIAETQPRRLLAAQAALAGAAGILIIVLSPSIQGMLGRETLDLSSLYVPWLAAAGICLAAASIAAGVFAWRGRILAGAALLSGTLAPAYSIASQSSHISGNAKVFAVDFYDHTLPWYFRRPVTMVRYKDELEEAIKWEPQKFVADLPGFARAWADAPAAYAVFSSSSFENLKMETNLPMEIVSRGPRYIIVRKP